MKALIVEDDRILSNNICESLKHKFDMTQAFDGEEAVSYTHLVSAWRGWHGACAGAFRASNTGHFGPVGPHAPNSPGPPRPTPHALPVLSVLFQSHLPQAPLLPLRGNSPCVAGNDGDSFPSVVCGRLNSARLFSRRAFDSQAHP